jgi:hypothetical protein
MARSVALSIVPSKHAAHACAGLCAERPCIPGSHRVYQARTGACRRHRDRFWPSPGAAAAVAQDLDQRGVVQAAHAELAAAFVEPARGGGERHRRAGHHDQQVAGAGPPHASRDGGVDHGDAAAGQTAGHRDHGLGSDGRHDHGYRAARQGAGRPARPEQNLFHLVSGRDHDRDDIRAADRGGSGSRVPHAIGCQRSGAPWRDVVAAHRVTRAGQARRHRRAHRAEPEPADSHQEPSCSPLRPLRMATTRRSVPSSPTLPAKTT